MWTAVLISLSSLFYKRSSEETVWRGESNRTVLGDQPRSGILRGRGISIITTGVSAGYPDLFTVGVDWVLHRQEKRLIRQLGLRERVGVVLISLYCLLVYPAPTTWIPFRRPAENSPRSDEYNAKRHALWLCLLARCLGTGLARRVADAHEYANPTPEYRVDMCADLYNNEIGLMLSQEIGESRWCPLLQCQKNVERALQRGKLAGDRSSVTYRLGPHQQERLLAGWKQRTGARTLPWREFR